ncbi:uncharacterized protein FOMMEDRAFT_19349 [Fomitiporia mediterranea MF3/22]|uniref:uncharacterized protein n=1 Tax=Fomitiporia mediterranea (strain MF3/22) TaxID=694068 RepID=UPI000440862B|nr:uncharacterized protein FOMMEDRAFT_19349 [Fomitiporia mediterranea MF3/22]EJD04031.1 hypothetical protein FOMMEDRAFT_19349 [Fomitiporia mediterranea MF3/22]
MRKRTSDELLKGCSRLHRVSSLQEFRCNQFDKPDCPNTRISNRLFTCEIWTKRPAPSPTGRQLFHVETTLVVTEFQGHHAITAAQKVRPLRSCPVSNCKHGHIPEPGRLPAKRSDINKRSPDSENGAHVGCQMGMTSANSSQRW